MSFIPPFSKIKYWNLIVWYLKIKHFNLSTPFTMLQIKSYLGFSIEFVLQTRPIMHNAQSVLLNEHFVVYFGAWIAFEHKWKNKISLIKTLNNKIKARLLTVKLQFCSSRPKKKRIDGWPGSVYFVHVKKLPFFVTML